MSNKTKGVIEALDNIKFDHAVWLSETSYSLKEIELYENRLLKLIEIYFGKDEQEALGVMLKDFGLQKDAILHIQGTIKAHVDEIRKKTSSNGELKSLIDSNHKKAREIINYFRKSYAHLKQKFHQLTDIKY